MSRFPECPLLPPNPGTDFQLGNYGIDTVAHVEPVPLYLTGIANGANGRKVVSGFGIPLKQYTVQATNDPRQPFTDFAPVTAAANGALQFEDPSPGSQRFYRVVAPPAQSGGRRANKQASTVRGLAAASLGFRDAPQADPD